MNRLFSTHDHVIVCGYGQVGQAIVDEMLRAGRDEALEYTLEGRVFLAGSPARLHFSKTDTRVWVPKRRPAMGLTLNLGRSAGARWFVFLLLLPTIAMTVLLAFGAGAGR